MKNLFSEIIRIELVKELLSEGRVEDAKARYPDYEGYVDFFVANDPSGNNKYLDWIMKVYVNEDYATKDLLVKYITIFHKNISKFTKKDINQYKTWDEFEKAVLPVKEEAERKEQDKKAEEGTKKLFNSQDWLLVRPLNHDSSCKYGAGTKWCTTAKGDPHHFNSYTKNDLLVYLLHKTSNTKFAFHYSIGDNEESPVNALAIFNPPDFDVSDKNVSGFNIRSIKKFLELLTQGEMQNLAQAEDPIFARGAKWGIIWGTGSYEADYGEHEHSLEDSLKTIISSSLSEKDNYFNFESLKEPNRFLEFLDLMGVNFYKTSDGLKIDGDPRNLKNHHQMEFENEEELGQYLTTYLSYGTWRDKEKFISDYLVNANSIITLSLALKEINKDAQIYLDTKKFRKLYGDGSIFKDINEYFNKNKVKGQPSITPEEAKGIISAFNKEIKIVKTEVKNKKEDIFKNLKPSKKLVDKLSTCAPVESYDDFRYCLRGQYAYDDFVTYQGKRKKINNFVENVLGSSDVTGFLMNYVKYRIRNNL